MSTDVELPRSATPVFPDVCVSCSAEEPDSTLAVSRRTSSWFSLLTLWIGRRHDVHAPCCSECLPAVRSKRRKRQLWLYGFAIAAVAVAVPVLGPLDRVYRKPAMIGLVILVTLPWAIIDAIAPLAFDMTVYRNTVTYEFEDEEYAEMFCELNEDAGATRAAP